MNKHKVKFIWIVSVIKTKRVRKCNFKIRTSRPIKVHTASGYMILISEP